MDPADFKFEDPEDTRDWAKRIFFSESCALETADGSGHTPHYIDSDIQMQTTDLPYPNGYIHLLLMSFVPGADPMMIYDDLTEDDLQIIQTQLTHTLELVTPVFVSNRNLEIRRFY